MKKKLLGIKRKPPGSFSSNRWQFVPIRFRSICSTHSSLVRYADDALLVCCVTRTNAFLSWPYGKKETNTNTKFCWLWRLHLCGINKELNLQSLSYKWCKANTRHYHIFWLSYKYMYKCLPKRNAQQDHHHHHKDVLNIHGYTNSYHSNHNKSSKKGFASFSVLEREHFQCCVPFQMQVEWSSKTGCFALTRLWHEVSLDIDFEKLLTKSDWADIVLCGTVVSYLRSAFTEIWIETPCIL